MRRSSDVPDPCSSSPSCPSLNLLILLLQRGAVKRRHERRFSQPPMEAAVWGHLFYVINCSVIIAVCIYSLMWSIFSSPIIYKTVIYLWAKRSETLEFYGDKILLDRRSCWQNEISFQKTSPQKWMNLYIYIRERGKCQQFNIKSMTK